MRIHTSNSAFGTGQVLIFFSLVAAHIAVPLCLMGKTIQVGGTDSAAIRIAIGQAEPGDTIHFPAGTYAMTESVKPSSGTRLVGDGTDKTILQPAGEGKPFPLLDLSDKARIEVCGLTLDGRDIARTDSGILAAHARHLLLHELTVRNLVKGDYFGPIGIYFSADTTDSQVVDCRFENIGVNAKYGGAIRFSHGSSRNHAERNRIQNTGRGGIFADNGSTDLVIRRNTISGSHGEGLGIEVWSHCDRAIIEDNRIDHWLSLDTSDACAVRRNLVSDKSGTCKFAGIELVASNGCVITDNVVDDGQQIGISLSGKPPKNYNFWGYDKVFACASWGAQLQGETGGIRYNYFYRCSFNNTAHDGHKPLYPHDAGHGFRINEDVHHLVVEQCEFAGNKGAGIQLLGLDNGKVDALSFVNCSIHNNDGPAVDGAAGEGVQWPGCQFKDNAGGNASPPPSPQPFPAPRPIAHIQAPATARAKEPISFTCVPAPVAGGAAKILWDFNDGTPSTDPQPSHVYEQPGRYRVTLLVWNAPGRATRAEQTIDVKPPLASPRPARK